MENFGDLLKIGIGEKTLANRLKYEIGEENVSESFAIIVAIRIINLRKSSVNWCALYRATSRVMEWYLVCIYVVFTFTFELMVHGYHEYQLIWRVPAVGEDLNCHRELGNSHDPYAVAVKLRL